MRREIPLVVVAAGDGTIGGGASPLIGSDTVIGIVPIGTMNNVARSLGVPLEIEAACALIGVGTTRHIDLGSVTSSAHPNAECFLECAGIGLSAITASGGRAFEMKRWAIVPKALRKFFEAKLGRVKITLDGGTIESSTRRDGVECAAHGQQHARCAGSPDG